MRRELGKNERDAAKGYWANGKFVKWVDTQADVDKAFVAWCLREPALRGHLLSKKTIEALPPDQQARLPKKDR